MNISTYIPATWRKPLYGAFAVIGLTIGAFQIGIASVSGAEPEWLTIAVNVFPFVATAIGFTAAANTIKPQDEVDWSGGSMADYATADDAVKEEV